jgi:putative addiction module CopG family antidote
MDGEPGRRRYFYRATPDAAHVADDNTSLNLSERHRRFIELQVKSGRHRSSIEVVDEALRRYKRDLDAERAAIDALWALAEKSERGEVAGDFTDVRDQVHLEQVIATSLGDALRRARMRPRQDVD